MSVKLLSDAAELSNIDDALLPFFFSTTEFYSAKLSQEKV